MTFLSFYSSIFWKMVGMNSRFYPQIITDTSQSNKLKGAFIFEVYFGS